MGIVSPSLAFFKTWQGIVEMVLRVTCIVSEVIVVRLRFYYYEYYYYYYYYYYTPVLIAFQYRDNSSVIAFPAVFVSTFVALSQYVPG